VFILYAIPIGLLLGFALRGRLSGLSTLRLDGVSVIFAALLIQVVLFGTRLGDAMGTEAATVLYVGSTLSVAIALLGNVRTPGMALAVAGAASNLVVIVANGGTMPASAAAYATLGWSTPVGYTNTSLLEAPVLPFLGDVIPLPAWLPMANVISIGDLLIAAGIAATIALSMRRGPASPAGRTAFA
jgi:hypothetical protein